MATENPIADALKKVGLGYVSTKDNGGIPADLTITNGELQWSRQTNDLVPGENKYGRRLTSEQQSALTAAGVSEVKK